MGRRLVLLVIIEGRVVGRMLLLMLLSFVTFKEEVEEIEGEIRGVVSIGLGVKPNGITRRGRLVTFLVTTSLFWIRN